MPLIFFLVFLFSIAIAPAAYAANGEFGNADITADDIGTESNPYLIDDEADLKKFRDIVNDGSADAHAKLTADITLSGDWTPIANYSYDNQIQYTGTFDGGGYAIFELSVSGSSYVGFFGYVGGGGVVKNLTIASGTVSGDGDGDVGGIAGRSDGKVENCANSADVRGDSYVGGIVGYNCAIVQNCTNSGKVSATWGNGNVGGIAGGNYKSTVKNCINSGDVSGTYSVGGIVGDVYYNSTVENCANLGDVSGDRNVGGIVGMNDGCTVQNCAYLFNDDVSYSKGIGNENDPDTVVHFDTIDGMNSKLVMTLSASIDPQSVSEDGKATITFSTSPGTPENAFDDENGAVRDVNVTSSNTGVASAEYAGDGTGTITVTGQSEGETTITVKATLHATDLSTLSDNQPSYLGEGEGTELTFTFTLTVSNTEQDEDDSTETESETKSGGSGGGCNAGTGALALLALIPLALRRKR